MKVDRPRLASSEAWNPHFLCELGMHISGAAQLWVCGGLGLRCVRKHRKSMSLAKCMANPCQWWLNILHVGSFKHSNIVAPKSHGLSSFLNQDDGSVYPIPGRRQRISPSIEGHIKTRYRHGRKDLPRNASLRRSEKVG